MRKLIFQEWLSMDGYAADSNDSVTFIESTTLNKYSDLDQLEWLDTIDTMLLGRRTYELFYEFWPTASTSQEVIADKLNGIPNKIVFSKSLRKAPWGKWPAATVEQDAVATVRDLKKGSGKDIVLWGSIEVAQDLMKADLIDEYEFRIVPVVLGSGRPLFERTGPLDFEMYGSKQYESGLILLQYKQSSPASGGGRSPSA
jgi:dihydrofolate reductase